MIKVKLVEYTGRGSDVEDYAARYLCFIKNTRLQGDPDSFEKYMRMPHDELAKELNYVGRTIRSSWEFITFDFHVTGVTRAFTHQMVRTRTASYAQKTQRVADKSDNDFVVTKPDTVASDPDANVIWDTAMGVVENSYQTLLQLGIPHQDARGLLPTNIHTAIMIHMNLRTLSDLVGKRSNLRAQGEYVEVVRGMVSEVTKVMPWAERFLFPDRSATPELDALLKEALGTAGPLDKPKLNEALKELDLLKAVWG